MKKTDSFSNFRNYMPMFGWVFMILWMGMLLAFTSLYMRQGFPGVHPLLAAGVMLFFWAAGLGASSHLFSLPCARGEVRNGALFVSEWTLRSMFSPKVHRFDLFEAPPALRIVHDRDSDGDPYFRLMLETPAGADVQVGEGGDLAAVEALRDKILSLWTGAV